MAETENKKRNYNETEEKVCSEEHKDKNSVEEVDSVDSITWLLRTILVLPNDETGGPEENRFVVTEEERLEQQQAIVDLLRGLRPSAPQPMIDRLPVLAKRIDQFLLNETDNKDSYMDNSTLLQRIRELATNKRIKT